MQLQQYDITRQTLHCTLCHQSGINASGTIFLSCNVDILHHHHFILNGDVAFGYRHVLRKNRSNNGQQNLLR